MTATASGSSSAVAVLEPVTPSMATTSAASPRAQAVGEPDLERLFGASVDHVEQPGGAWSVGDPGQVDDHGNVRVATAPVASHVLIDADRVDAVEPMGVVDQGPLAFRKDGVVGSALRQPESLAKRATVRPWTTIPSSAHRNPRRESFSRGSAAIFVPWCHTCPQSAHR